MSNTESSTAFTDHNSESHNKFNQIYALIQKTEIESNKLECLSSLQSQFSNSSTLSNNDQQTKDVENITNQTLNESIKSKLKSSYDSIYLDHFKSIDANICNTLISNSEYINKLESELLECEKINIELKSKSQEIYEFNKDLFYKNEDSNEFIDKLNVEFTKEKDDLIQQLNQEKEDKKRLTLEYQSETIDIHDRQNKRITCLNENIENLYEKISEQEKSESEMYIKQTNLQKEYLKIKNTLTDTNLQNDELKEGIDNIESLNKNQSSELNQLKLEHNQCTIKINSLTTEKEQYKILLHSKTEQESQSQINYQKLIVDNSNLQSKIEEIQFKLKTKDEQLKVQERDNILIVKNSDEIQHTYEQLKNENIKLNGVCTNMKKCQSKLVSNQNAQYDSLKVFFKKNLNLFPEVQHHLTYMKPLNTKTDWFEAICQISEELTFWNQYVSLTDSSDSNKDIRCSLNSVTSMTQNINTILTRLKVMCDSENIDLNINSDALELLKVINGISCNMDKIHDKVEQINTSQLGLGLDQREDMDKMKCVDGQFMKDKSRWIDNENEQMNNDGRRIQGELKNKLENVKHQINKGNRDNGRDRLGCKNERGVLKENQINNQKNSDY